MLSGKMLLAAFLQLAPQIPAIMGMEENTVVWATDTEKYILVISPKTEAWKSFDLMAGERIRSGVGPVVLSTKQPYHAMIPRDVFGVPLRAAAYPLLEGDEIIGVVGITFGLDAEDQVAQMANELASKCMQLKFK